MVGENLSALQMLQLYIGNGSLMLLFVLAIVYLWVKEKQKGIRRLFIFLPLVFLGIFLFPPLANFVRDRLGEGEVYYRLLWLLPIGTVIPYAVTKFYVSCKKKWIGYIVVCLVGIYVILGGTCVYRAPNLVRTQNLYQLPQEVIEICDEIVIPGREVKAAFPHELVQYVRQYTPFVVMAYGYDSLVDRWMLADSFEQEMSKEVSDASKLASLARERNTHFIILNKNHFLAGTMEDQEFFLFCQTENYLVYLDEYADLKVK